MLRVYSVLTAEGAEHENTTTEGSLAQTSFPSSFWQPGKVILFKGACVVNDNNSTDTLTLSLRFGIDGTTVTSDDLIGISNAVDVADADVAIIDGHAVCRDVGDGTYQLQFGGVISDPDASDILVNHFSALSTAFDPAVATYLTYTGDWSVAHADNEAAASSWMVLEATG